MRVLILGSSTDTSKDTLFEIKLDEAKNVWLRRVYPFGFDEEPTYDSRFYDWQTRCAIELYNRMGDEGYTRYSENGLSYSLGDDTISAGLIQELPPPHGEVIG